MANSHSRTRILFNAHSLAKRPRLWQKIAQYVKAHRLDWELIPPQLHGLAAQSNDALQAGVNLLAIVGGDGSVHEMAEMLMGKDCALAILPGGTGNDFCRAAGIPRKISAALDVMRTGRDRTIDLGRCNGTVFINVAGIGFDAQVVKNAIPYKESGLTGSLAYMRSVFYTLRHMQYHSIVDCQGLSASCPDRMLLVAAGNGHYIGGGMKITPLAELDDGLLDVCLVKDIKVGRFLQLFPGFLGGKHIHATDAITYEKVRRVSLRFDRPIPMQLDGELSESDHFDVEVLPKALTLRVPAQ